MEAVKMCAFIATGSFKRGHGWHPRGAKPELPVWCLSSSDALLRWCTCVVVQLTGFVGVLPSRWSRTHRRRIVSCSCRSWTVRVGAGRSQPLPWRVVRCFGLDGIRAVCLRPCRWLLMAVCVRLYLQAVLPAAFRRSGCGRCLGAE